MQDFIVNLKEDASDADVADAKKSIESQGGTIKDVTCPLPKVAPPCVIFPY